MFDTPQIGEALGAIVSPGGLVTTDSEALTIRVRSFLAEYGFNPDSVFEFGNVLMRGAVQSGEPPEETVVGAFAVGIAIGTYLTSKAKN